MSEFSKYLTKLKNNRNLTSASLAELCDMNKVIIWQWTEGKHLPESWNRLEMVTEKLRLTREEKANVKSAYEYEILGEEQKKVFDKIKEILGTLSRKRVEYISINNPINKALYEISRGGGQTYVLPDFIKLGNKMDVLQGIQSVMEYMCDSEQSDVYARLHTISENILEWLKGFCNKKQEINMELIITRNNKNTYEALELTNIVLDLMMQKVAIKCYCCDVAEELGQNANNWIMSDEVFIQFSDDMSFGMLTRDKEWIKFFMDNFRQLRGKAPQICVGKCEALSYVYRSANNQNRIRTIEHMPCFSVSLTEEILENCIHREVPFRDELIQGILKNYRGYLSFLDDFINVFEKQGVIEFMETGKVDVFPYEIYEPIPLPDRCQMLEDMISMAERADMWQALMIKEGIGDLKGVHVEMRMLNDEMTPTLLDIHFDEGKNEQMELVDESSKKECWRFFEYLIEFGYVYSKEETLDKCRDILREYRKKI